MKFSQITAAQLEAAVINTSCMEYKAVLRTVRVAQLRQVIHPDECHMSKFPVDFGLILGDGFAGLNFNIVLSESKLAAIEVACEWIKGVEQVDLEGRKVLVKKVFEMVELLGIPPEGEPTVYDLEQIREMRGQDPRPAIPSTKDGHTLH